MPRASRTAPTAAPARGVEEPVDELRLADVPLKSAVELVRFDLPHDQVEALLERGVLPGCRLCPVRRSPSGDPIVDVEGSLLALRREMARCLCVRMIVDGATTESEAAPASAS